MPPKQGGYIYRSGNVRLLLLTQPGMTWGMWGNTIRGLRLFVQKWEIVSLDFDVWDGEEGMGQDKWVGNGYLSTQS